MVLKENIRAPKWYSEVIDSVTESHSSMTFNQLRKLAEAFLSAGTGTGHIFRPSKVFGGQRPLILGQRLAANFGQGFPERDEFSGQVGYVTGRSPLEAANFGQGLLERDVFSGQVGYVTGRSPLEAANFGQGLLERDVFSGQVGDFTGQHNFDEGITGQTVLRSESSV
ncbi:hypothetical protein FOL47_011124 [Perkinsus chesapeaki]|uniref:Uncharacterized protein n=1 Tax=Perkinsus chesapeaki TaxID=330153 RepID=A0A7J6MN72_PERCH|nr:hypothetical protein FOL47_011124 [Perkinsus chesapeaki]